MRKRDFWIAASCILAGLGLFPLFSSGASPASTEKVLYSFAGGTDGENPSSDLTLDSEGNLYGTTTYGGEVTCVYHGETFPGCGTVFELKRTADGWSEQILYRFNINGNSSGGALPAAGVIFDKAGNLYGTTEGIPNECGQGNVFELTPNSQGAWTETVLYSFTCEGGGYNPATDLVFDDKGDLFGTAGNIVFELLPRADGSWEEVTLHTFTGKPDGAIFSSGVLLDSQGHVYGMTQSGGTGTCMYNRKTFGCGIVYELIPSAEGAGHWAENVVYNFARGGGFAVNPSGGLILDRPGHLFITTAAGGDGLGTVAELTRSQKGWEQSVLYRFYGGPDGNQPAGRLVINAGVGFGVTNRGGTNGLGTVFGLKGLDTGGWKAGVLYSFAGGSDARNPTTGLVSDSQGNLYGTTIAGGVQGCYEGCGTVYEVTP